MTEAPLVTVVVPVRNEEHNLAACLAAIAAQDHPADRLEVLVVDGQSSDRTTEVAAAAFLAHPRLQGRVVHNGPGTIARNLNAGLAEARGSIVCRVDAKSRLAPAHVRRCIEHLAADPQRVNVGGMPVAVVDQDTVSARAIARAYNNRWTTGLSRYKRGGTSGPSDTVYLGAFATDRLRAVGGWDERLLVNEDYELNQRLGAEGIVWFDADLVVGHVHGKATILDLFRRQRELGVGKVRFWRLTGRRPHPRQWVLLLTPALGAVGLLTWAARGRRPGVRLTLGALGATAVLAAAEAAGADDPPATGPVDHAAGTLACAAVGSGWLVGIAEGLLTTRRQP